jgi:hypothetical protein
MSHEEPTVHDAPAPEVAVHPAPGTTVPVTEAPVYEPIEREDEWLDDRVELPGRPRRRLLSPAPLALLAVLLSACGFIGGVLVEKGQSASGSTGAGASGLSSRLAALRARGAGGAGGGVNGGGGRSPAGGGGSRPVAGQVAYINGSTLYVTNAEGNTIKVTTSVGTSVSKMVKTSVHAIHPGETVTVTGASAASGAISAESISVGSAGGGFAALLGGSGVGSGSGSPTGGGASGGAGEQALFGKGG